MNQKEILTNEKFVKQFQNKFALAHKAIEQAKLYMKAGKELVLTNLLEDACRAFDSTKDEGFYQ